MPGYADFSDEAEQRRSQAGAALQFGVDANPDQSAAQLNLARRYGLPLSLVESDPSEFQRRARCPGRQRHRRVDGGVGVRHRADCGGGHSG
jgi:hypothetical protein